MARRKKVEIQKPVIKNKANVQMPYIPDNYTPEEWKLRKKFEGMYTDSEKFSCYVSDFEELNV